MPLPKFGTVTGTSLTEAEKLTLKYMPYNPATNEIEPQRTVAAEAATIKAGNHAISSLGENFGFINVTTGIVFTPSWSGIKNQEDPVNQGATGIIPPTHRVYLNDLQDVPSNSPAADSGSVDYVVNSVLPFDISFFAQTVMVDQDITADDWLRYEVRFGGADDTIVYLQILTGLEASKGDVIKWWFKHPAEAFGGQAVNARMLISKGDQDATREPLQVRVGADNTTRWGIAHVRTFADLDICLGVLPLTLGSDIRYSASYAADTASASFTVPVDEAIGFASFNIFDATGNFHINPLSIELAGDTYVLDKKNRQYHFWKTGDAWEWSETTRKIGNAGGAGDFGDSSGSGSDNNNKIYTESVFGEDLAFQATESGGVLHEFQPIQVQAGKGADISFQIPTRSNHASWGGCFFNLNVRINGVWYNLGNTGYASNMVNNVAAMDIYKYSQPWNFPDILGLTEDYELVIELTASAFAPNVNVNYDVRANAEFQGLDSRGTVAEWAKAKNYMTLNVREYNSASHKLREV